MILVVSKVIIIRTNYSVHPKCVFKKNATIYDITSAILPLSCFRNLCNLC